MKKKINNELVLIENGIIPDSLNFTAPEDKIFTIENEFDYTTFNMNYWISKFDPELLAIFPCLNSLVEKAFKENAGRSALEEMNERYRIAENILLSNNDIDAANDSN